jgi:uncharacterized protein with HEPN domain
MPLEINKYLFDVQTSISSIYDYIASCENITQYQENKLVKRAVERELEIIGEAINKLLKIAPEIEIKESRRIVDLRNWIIHGYDKVDDIIIWGIILKDLPALKKQVDELLEKQ